LIAPRGEMENRIKECRLDFDLNADRTSTARCERTSTPKFGRRRRRGRGGEHASRPRFGHRAVYSTGLGRDIGDLAQIL